MKAIIHKGEAGMSGVSYGEITAKELGSGEVRITLKSAGLNHRDLFVLHRHKSTEPALIIGSDGAGIVAEIGEGVSGLQVGDEVIINPGLGWKDNSDAPPNGFEIVGFPYNGTFSESIVIPAENAAAKPSFLSWEEAGVLSLAGLTAYRALFTRGKVQSGMKVFIPGIGGGVATFLLQFALAAGAEVYVSSRSVEKNAKAMELGATGAFDSNEDWKEALGDTKMDLVIESVGAATFNQSMEVLRPGGTLVIFGSSTGDEVKFNLRNFFYGQHNLLGSTMGSAEEYKEMLSLVEKHQIKPVMDQTYALEQYEEAFARLEKAEQVGKIAFRIS
ncbi:zinc-binding dehydrogenase [Cytobacillus purgationiresistens]|uniref:Zinc-binding alcohol dehydrogenase/oxidoreductase n=1 Tax=Cytobacillus purgationiresistens TaxID=863449 RepID=A0ABU0AM65_9BACI|nr:zinc-binding dehydrogenase [Cytobacillus purgationiresistens]MDQ0271488.1 zinc-binding alcohol dehydrogenase/oxidoreductase [Cytobacillus purgationiresistens]